MMPEILSSTKHSNTIVDQSNKPKTSEGSVRNLRQISYLSQLPTDRTYGSIESMSQKNTTQQLETCQNLYGVIPFQKPRILRNASLKEKIALKCLKSAGASQKRNSTTQLEVGSMKLPSNKNSTNADSGKRGMLQSWISLSSLQKPLLNKDIDLILNTEASQEYKKRIIEGEIDLKGFKREQRIQTQISTKLATNIKL